MAAPREEEPLALARPKQVLPLLGRELEGRTTGSIVEASCFIRSFMRGVGEDGPALLASPGSRTRPG